MKVCDAKNTVPTPLIFVYFVGHLDPDFLIELF